jgi:hypothetical protein
LNRLNESLVSEIQERGIAIALRHRREILGEDLQPEPAEPAVDFEALVQACEQLAVELEARTGHKAVQHVKIRRVAARR